MDPDGFPLETPWRAMEGADTPAAKYLLKQSRKHESEAKDLRQQTAELKPLAEQKRAADEANKSEAQREIDRLRAENEALAKQRAEDQRSFGVGLVEARLSAAADAKGKTLAQIKTIAGNLDRFLSGGAMDTESVDAFLAELPDKTTEVKQPAARNPLGAGRQTPASVGGLQAGVALFANRHKKAPPA